MSNYQHILVPTDFSKPSEVAAGRAVELAKFYKARLSVIHVVDYVPPGYVAVELPADLASASKLSERAEKKLAEWTQRLGLAPSNKWVEVGSPKHEIVRVAKENAVDLIVVGSHGTRGIGRLLGSTTSAVQHEASCDVLCVHANPDAAAGQ
jgi:universal stress protein A